MEIRNALIRQALRAAAPARSRIVLSGSLSIVLAVGLLAVTGRVSAGEDRTSRYGTWSSDNAETNLPGQYSEGNRAVRSNLTFDDVQFPQNTFPLAPLSWNLSARFKDGVLTLLAPAAPGLDVNHRRPVRSVISEGPIDKAQFVLQTLAGTTTISDASGHVIWSDAAFTAQFDLTLNRDSTGKADLIDRQGVILWSGNMKSPDHAESSYTGGRDNYTLNAGGLTIEGNKQSAQITDNTGVRLWSGALPFHPNVAINGPRGYVHCGPDGFESGSDRKVRFQFVAASGEVIVDDEEHAQLGTRNVPYLRMGMTSISTRQTTVAETPKSVDLPSEFLTPRAELSIDGTIYVTYRDPAGKILRRFRVDKNGSATGYIDAKS